MCSFQTFSDSYVTVLGKLVSGSKEEFFLRLSLSITMKQQHQERVDLPWIYFSKAILTSGSR